MRPALYVPLILLLTFAAFTQTATNPPEPPASISTRSAQKQNHKTQPAHYAVQNDTLGESLAEYQKHQECLLRANENLENGNGQTCVVNYPNAHYAGGLFIGKVAAFYQGILYSISFETSTDDCKKMNLLSMLKEKYGEPKFTETGGGSTITPGVMDNQPPYKIWQNGTETVSFDESLGSLDACTLSFTLDSLGMKALLEEEEFRSQSQRHDPPAPATPASIAPGKGGAELAILRNGFSIRHDHHMVLGETTRLYLTADGSRFTDIPTDEITGYEKELVIPTTAKPPVAASEAAKPTPGPASTPTLVAQQQSQSSGAVPIVPTTNPERCGAGYEIQTIDEDTLGYCTRKTSLKEEADRAEAFLKYGISNFFEACEVAMHPNKCTTQRDKDLAANRVTMYIDKIIRMGTDATFWVLEGEMRNPDYRRLDAAIKKMDAATKECKNK